LNGISIYEKRIVHQVGYLQELNRNARSTEHKIKVQMLSLPLTAVLTKKTESAVCNNGIRVQVVTLRITAVLTNT
jgi:hypothetical protein